jgi:hypothetical protein
MSEWCRKWYIEKYSLKKIHHKFHMELTQLNPHAVGERSDY